MTMDGHIVGTYLAIQELAALGATIGGFDISNGQISKLRDVVLKQGTVTVGIKIGSTGNIIECSNYDPDDEIVKKTTIQGGTLTTNSLEATDAHLKGTNRVDGKISFGANSSGDYTCEMSGNSILFKKYDGTNLGRIVPNGSSISIEINVPNTSSRWVYEFRNNGTFEKYLWGADDGGRG